MIYFLSLVSGPNFFFFVNIFAEKFPSKCHWCKFYFLIPIRQFPRVSRFQFDGVPVHTGSCVFYRKKKSYGIGIFFNFLSWLIGSSQELVEEIGILYHSVRIQLPSTNIWRLHEKSIATSLYEGDFGSDVSVDTFTFINLNIRYDCPGISFSEGPQPFAAMSTFLVIVNPTKHRQAKRNN